MKIKEIMETTTAGAIATVSFPMTPGTSKKKQRKAVDPFGYTVNKENKNNPAGAYKTPVSNETGQPIRR